MSECVLRPQPELTALAGTSTPLTRPEGITGMNTTEYAGLPTQVVLDGVALQHRHERALGVARLAPQCAQHYIVVHGSEVTTCTCA